MNSLVDLSPIDRVIVGLRALQEGRKTDFEQAAHTVQIAFAGQPNIYEANRVLCFQNYLEDRVYRRPVITGMSAGCFKVFYGYTALSHASENRLRDALRIEAIAPLAADLAIEQVQYKSLTYQFKLPEIFRHRS